MWRGHAAEQLLSSPVLSKIEKDQHLFDISASSMQMSIWQLSSPVLSSVLSHPEDGVISWGRRGQEEDIMVDVVWPGQCPIFKTTITADNMNAGDNFVWKLLGALHLSRGTTI